MQVFNAEQVHAALDYPKLIEGLRAHHLHDIDAREAVVLEQPAPSGAATHFLTLPAWRNGRAMGAKLVTVFPDNEHNGSGLPSVQAVYVLFDGADGAPRALIDGAALTLRKTAADSGLGAQFLAPRSPERMLMVGAGAMAPHLILAHRAARPSLARALIWNRTPERAQALVDQLAKEPALAGMQIAATTDLEAAAREAEVISCATMAREPLILGEWLRPGAHLDLVGSFRLEMRECDDEALRRASVFVDSPWSAMNDCGEIPGAVARGAISKSDVLADNFTLARGAHPGRTGADEITLYKNGGGGHLDLMVAQILMGDTK